MNALKCLYLVLAIVFVSLIVNSASARGGRFRRNDVNVFVNGGFLPVAVAPASVTVVNPNSIYGFNAFAVDPFGRPLNVGYGGCGGFRPSGFRTLSVYSGGGCW